MKKIKENDSRILSDSKKGSKGTTIADDKQIDFLFGKLQHYCNNNLLNDSNKPTKTTVKPVVALFNNRFKNILEEDIKHGKDLKSKIEIPKCVTAESIAELFDKKKATNNSFCIYQLAGLVLFLDKGETNVFEHASLIEERKSWTVFIDAYRDDININNLQHSYLFYYWNESGISIAELTFTADANNNKWVYGDMRYYNYHEKKYTRDRHTINLSFQNYINYQNTISINAEYTDTAKGHMIQLTLFASSNLQEKSLAFGTYAIIKSSISIASGIGLLIKYDDTNAEIDKINQGGEVDAFIFNILYQKRESLYGKILESTESSIISDFSEVKNIKQISGVWKAYYLRHDKPDLPGPNEKRGGIELNIIRIRPDGKIYLKHNKKEADNLEGFLSYPSENKKIIKANISTKEKVSKFHLFLTSNDDDNGSILEGVYCGWTYQGVPFGSLIRLEKIGNSESNSKQIFENNNPGFFRRATVVNESGLTESLLRFFRNDQKYLDIPQDCLPKSFDSSEEMKTFEGKYYLLSRDYEEGLLDKAKLTIEGNGKFQIHYPHIIYSGNVSSFTSEEPLSNKYLFLEVKEKRTGNNHVIKYAGGLLFQIETAAQSSNGFFKKISIIPGVSIRINSSHDPQVKKEFLIPSVDENYFDNEAVKKYAYWEEENFLKNVKNAQDREFAKNIIKALKGRESNIMIIRKESVNNILEEIRETDYAELYFNAFIFEVLFSKKNSQSKQYMYYYEALLHGFTIFDAEAKFESIFGNYKVTLNVQNKIIDLVKKLEESFYEYSKKEQLENLMRRLNSPVERMATEKFVKLLNEMINLIQRFPRT